MCTEQNPFIEIKQKIKSGRPIPVHCESFVSPCSLKTPPCSFDCGESLATGWQRGRLGWVSSIPRIQPTSPRRRGGPFGHVDSPRSPSPRLSVHRRRKCGDSRRPHCLGRRNPNFHSAFPTKEMT